MYAQASLPLRKAEVTQEINDSAYGGSETLSQREDSADTATQVLPRSPENHLKSRRLSSTSAETQLKYNHDRHEISRSITQATLVAKDFKIQATNTEWPMQIPLSDKKVAERPGCPRTSTAHVLPLDGAASSPRRMALKRASTTVSAEELAPVTEAVPAVLSAEVKEQLQILRPEVMMAAHEENIIHTMNPKAVGEIMEQQFIKVQRHLNKLHVRVEDISSKVLVTGDLNAGKSTLCNALLRQRVLPVDQQPCTEVFCELLDARDNDDRHEVHAVLNGKEYDRENAETYSLLTYEELSDSVMQPHQFSALKVYVDDERPLSESLLRNGVVDISLIDAPGLNSDSLQTTAVYARQEEIDVVVFVVSAENHFTLSAKQFLWNASNEKAYLFIVVNRFDNIKDKERCRRLILEQVSKLSPKTYEAASELVHFVSAEGVIERTDEISDEAFEQLETQLRNFVLNKRSQSKLAPAKNFVGKFWADVQAIAKYNSDVAVEEHARLQGELLDVDSKIKTLSKDRQLAVDSASAQNEVTSESVRQYAKDKITLAAQGLESLSLDRKYVGLFDCVNYAGYLRDQYLKSIQYATIDSELYCREATSGGVDLIRQIGLTHLDPEQYRLKDFNVNLMFSRKRDAIQRNMPVELGVLDFIDLANFEAIVGTSSLSAALVLYGGKTLGWSALVDTSIRVLNTVGVERTPKLLGGVAAIAVAGLCTYVIIQIPSALQKNLAKKVQQKVLSADYSDSNANRISNECRKVLQIPENELRLAFASKVEAEQRSKFAIEKQLLTTTATIDFFKRQSQIIVKEGRRLDKIVL